MHSNLKVNKIAILRSHTDIGSNPTGGAQYLNQVVEILGKKYVVNIHYLYYRENSPRKPLYRVLRFLRMIYLLKFNKFNEDIFILDRRTMAFVRRASGKKYIGIVHHYDEINQKNVFKRLLLRYTTKRGTRNVDRLITVSRYWRDFYQRRGAQNVRVIHNAFQTNKFSQSELKEFKVKHNLCSDRPLIYIGMNSAQKGIIDVYTKLSNGNYYLVSSGKRKTDLPIKNFDLEYDDYLKLLAVVDLSIIMSKIPEGWSRNAHECMLMKTPVIGSGKAGMGELLAGGRQIICNDINMLPSIVENLLSNRKKRIDMGSNGYHFAKDFTKDTFAKDWLELVERLTSNNNS